MLTEPNVILLESSCKTPFSFREVLSNMPTRERDSSSKEKPGEPHPGRCHLEGHTLLLLPHPAWNLLPAAVQHCRRDHRRTVPRQGGPGRRRRWHEHDHKPPDRLLHGPCLRSLCRHKPALRLGQHGAREQGHTHSHRAVPSPRST